MAKRSPILGYNHNLRYRGVVFHVQTEDSGVLSPHLFTHLFHGGVIVSTRKLVYDAGSNEEAIKALMQAQHKAVMKDLRKGAFDEKIDLYLVGTEGLEPRASGTPMPTPSAEHEASDRAKTEIDAPAAEAPAHAEAAATIPNVAPPRTPTPARVPTPAQAPKIPPAQVSAKSTQPRASTPPPIPARGRDDSQPVIEISIDDDSSIRLRAPRDTAVEDAPAGDKRNTPSLGAATLPPVARPAARPPSRPAIQTPAVVTRPPSEDARSRRDSDVIEVYAPPPPSVDAPPGVRPGAYSVSRTNNDQGAVPMREKTGRIQTSPIPSGLGRPRLPSSRTPVAGSQVPETGQRRPPSDVSRTQPDAPPVRPPPAVPQPRPRTPTPARLPATPSSSARTASTGSSGVVMSRPAVIVGAPPKPATTGQQRVRKASEDAGRGFGQGLISEKSLDEVILAYLSEDAEGEK